MIEHKVAKLRSFPLSQDKLKEALEQLLQRLQNESFDEILHAHIEQIYALTDGDDTLKKLMNRNFIYAEFH